MYVCIKYYNLQGCANEAADQDEWLVEEIEQSKLCGCHIVIFSYHRSVHVHLVG